MKEKFYTTSEAAALLKISRRGVQKILEHRHKTGKFPGAVKYGRDWLIPACDVNAYINKINNQSL